MKADTAFFLSPGRTIVLCGYRDTEAGPGIYSEFVLAACGADTVIDFWDALTVCRLRMAHDTLIVEELARLPAGKDFRYEYVIWSKERFYFKGTRLYRHHSFNRRLKKYDGKQIAAVLKEFETAKGGLDEDKMGMVNRLFMAAISGSVRAKKYFGMFATRFGALDGYFSEEYHDLALRLRLWQTAE